jgi:hypothetical protein
VLNVDSKAQIKVYFNGAYVSNFNYNVTSKALNTTLNLQEGTNTITVTATNTAGSDSKTANIIYEKPQVKQPPVVNFIVPSSNPHTSVQPTMNITASVLNVDSKNDIKVYVNGYVKTNFTYNASTKQVNFVAGLIEGANSIEVTGTNEVGSDHEATTIIYNKPEVPKPPVVTFLDPIMDPTIVYNSSYSVVAKVLNVTSSSQITLKINGIQSYNFAYSASSKQMTFGTNLLIGANVIEITATNNVGSDSETTTIIRKRTIPKAPPVVNITYPATDNQIFHTANITLTASVLNVNSASNIAVWINGNPVSGFTYNVATKVLTLPLQMVEGVNTVKITGTNSDGSDTDVRKIIYKIPAVPTPPTVNFVNPPTTPYSVSNENYTITANTTNIDSKSQITMLFNGNLVQNGYYTLTSSKQILFNTDLIPGNNIFEIIVTNNDGTDDAMAIVTYQKDEVPCIIPTVGYISPVPYSTVTDPNVTIDAQINNYSQGTTVEMIVNGASQGFMAYNSGTSIASLATTLNEGSNAIKVIVTNDCGTNQATFTLNYIAPEAPCVDPELTALSNLSNVTQSNTISVQAGVTEISNSNQITVTLNGTATPFQFDQGTGTISVNNASLAIGSNTIIITATNDCGSASISYQIVRKECHLPLISNPSHANGFSSTDQSISFTANVSNAIASQIELVVNNISQSFNFNQGVLSSAINLQEGSNTILINAANACGTATQTYTLTYTNPCEPIAVSLVTPPANQATVTDDNYSIQLHVSGSLVASGVSATHNGNNIGASFDNVAGDVTINGITLTEGVNTIVVNLTNDCSSETVTYTVTYNGCQPPAINVSNLTSGAVVNTSSIDLSAVIQNSNGVGNIQLTVNGTTQSFNFDAQSNVLTSSINLNEGTNAIILTVNGCEVKTKTINVNYEVPCQNISYTLMSPSSNSQTVVDENYAISLNLQEVSGQQQISVLHNGNAHPFHYDAGNHVLNISGITLINGANTVVVNATNDCSSETITYNIQYNGCQPPVITLGSNSSSATTALYSFSASVTNIGSQNELQVLLNSAPVSFVYDSQSGNISGEVTLVEGQNTIQINANGCAADSKIITVTYVEEDCEPVVSGSFAADHLSATANSTKDLSNVVLKFHDGTTQKFENLSGYSATFSGTGAHEGKCIVGMWIKSGCNQSDDGPGYGQWVPNSSYSGSCDPADPCDQPEINLNGNPTSAGAASYTLIATITNVSGTGDIIVKQNNQTVQHSFSNGSLSCNLTLVEGNNTISIEANGCATVTESITVNYTIPCNPVNYNLVSPSTQAVVVNGNTTSISLNVTNVDNASAISAMLNGAATTFTFANNVITLSNLSLVEGANALAITFSNACSSETVTYSIESDQCDTPVITVANNSITTNEPLYTFSCNVQNITNANDLQVQVNGQTVNSTFSNGVLTAQMSLQEGANTVIVTANGCETTSVTYTVTYEIACDPISFTHQIPANNDTIFQETNSTVIKINATNVEQSGIQAKLNGTVIPFTFANGTITVNTSSLVTGHNTIVIHMTNDCSTSDAAFHIEVGEPCAPPVITFTNSSTSVNSVALNFTANVTNIDNVSAIVVKLNNQPVQVNFNNGAITANLTLNQGDNVITIDAAGCESVSGSWTVNYTPACDPPVISISNSSSTVENPTLNLSATVTHVSSSSDIVVKHNGQIVQHTYNAGAVTATITLAEGANTITIDANACQNTSASYEVTYAQECEAPVIFIDPTITNTENSSYNFTATVTNVNNASDIILKLNGQIVQHTYSNGTVSATLTLSEGANTITIEGNGCETTSATHTVTYSSGPCGPRFNPGNSDWQFCLVTPNGTYNRSDLANNNSFSYSGPATAAYFKPIAGGGDAIVNGQPYPVQNGQYYLFEGSLTVDVSSSHPGSMGHWEICISSNTTPEFGNGNNRPESPCETKSSTGGNNTQGGSTVGGGNNTATVSAPTIKNVNPMTTSVSSTTSTYTFKAKVGNVTSKDKISLLFNGKAATNFVFNPSSGDVTLQVSLRTGANTIKLSAANGDKKANRSWNISYKPTTNNSGNTNTTTTVLTPKIVNISPSTTSAKSSVATYTFKAKIQNVTSKGNIKLSLNGTNITTFTFNSKTQQVTAVLRLKSGANTVKLTGTNSGKSDSRSYTINYNTGTGKTTGGINNTGGTTTTTTSMPSPTITKMNPSGSVASSTISTFMFKAKVANVSSKGDLILTVNGRTFKTFSYSSGSGLVTAVVKLNPGANSIRLTAKNTSNTAIENFTITYTPKTGGTTKTTGGGTTKTTGGGTTKTTGGGTTKTTGGGTTKTTGGGTTKTVGGGTTKTTGGTTKTTGGGTTKTTGGGTTKTVGGGTTKTTGGTTKTTGGGTTKTTGGGTTKTTGGGTITPSRRG